jgi:hypothetical protein
VPGEAAFITWLEFADGIALNCWLAEADGGFHID